MLQLNESNWKCANCKNYTNIQNPCIEINDNKVYPNVCYELFDNCEYFDDKYLNDFKVDLSNEDKIIVTYKTEKRIYSGTVNVDPNWDDSIIRMAVERAKEEIINQINMDMGSETQIESKPDIEEISNENVAELITKLNNLLNNNTVNKTSSVNDIEKMLDGDTHISWFERVTSWKRVLNAARRTIGRNQLDKEPSDSWKAKILLAEHSPIRLLEYDFGWEKIRQWVTAHLVRHHEGCEKFVHSQRGDRRELPCDRDHIYQGARNDMDMTVNAQALISISRKRCCMCASKETREAWGQVLDKLNEIDPVLRSKCVRECVYRGFCPEWMSKCKYCYSPAYWLELKNYRNTTFGTDETWKTNEELKLMVSSIGRISDLEGNLYEEKADVQGAYVTINNERHYVRDIMDVTYDTTGLNYVDGNKYNNALSNLV